MKLNRDDVAVTYQWQMLNNAPGQVESQEAIYPYGEGESTDYAFLLDGMTEEDLLAVNPDAVWPGIEMYLAEKEKQEKSRALTTDPIHIENGTPNTVLNPEGAEIEETEIAWRDIEGATENVYQHTVQDNEADLAYRCVITITDEAYLAEEAQASADAASSQADELETSEAEILMPMMLQDEAAAADAPRQMVSDSMYIDVPAAEIPVPMLMSIDPGDVSAVALSADNQWLVNVTQNMEYITAPAYQEHEGEAANNPYWTKLSGGARADGSKYLPTSLTDSQMEVLSAWYGKTVYVRLQGTSGPGTAIEIPAYTGVDYQTGEKVLYKSAVKIFNAYVPDTGRSFYNAFLRTALNDGWAANGCHITIDTASIEAFNRIPTAVLTNAEGDYVYDLVIVGSAAYMEPDISGAAAWALADYIGEGYGFMIGHDMMYGYAGVNADPNYEPNPVDTFTPYADLNGGTNGHWNMNWLMGVNAYYTDTSPYAAASMILNIGDYNDKSTMYGDDSGSSTLRIKQRLSGDPVASVAARCPTNWPYTQMHDGTDFAVGELISGTATHTNQQMAFGTVWIDYASHSLDSKGGSVLVEDTVDGVFGTNNFYLTSNGNFGMSQIGHKSENLNLAKIDECYILANTVMYLSQRQQCQVCQSQQGGHKDIHFVHRISTAEQLAKLNEQDKYWFVCPIDDCYMLTDDIVLPSDWEPIHGFRGHFDADGHGVSLGTNGAPLFEQVGTDPAAWNLGEDKTQGTPAISADGARTTGIARVVGYLKDLFKDSATNYAGWKIIVHGTDGKDYDCLTNLEGKYVVSNLPCTGIMPASVYDTAGNEIEAGRVYTLAIEPGIWDTDITRPLQLVAPGAQPVKDTAVYESQTAIMAEGGAWLSNHVYTADEVRWEYRTSSTAAWQPVTADKFAGVTVKVYEGESQDNFKQTRTELTIPQALDEWSGYRFRAAFSYQGQVVTTADDGVAAAGYNGLLTVRRKMSVTAPEDQTIWIGDNAVYETACDALYSPERGKTFAGRVLAVTWQYRTSSAGAWQNVLDDAQLKKSAKIETSVTATGDEITPWRTASKLTLQNCPESYTGLQFRTLYSYVGGGNKAIEKYSALANLTVRGPSLTVRWIAEQPNRAGMADKAEGSKAGPLWLDQTTHTTGSNAAVYTAEISYMPGAAELGNGGTPPQLSGQWKYHTYEDQRLKVWDAAAAQSAAGSVGAKTNPTVTFGDPVYVEDRAGAHIYRVTMSISNVDEMFDAGQTRFFFAYFPTLQFAGETLTANTNDMPLCLDYLVNVKFHDGVQNDANGDGVSDSDVCLVDPALGNKAYSDWSFPNLTLQSGRSTLQSMVLMFDDRAHIDDHYGAGNPNYDKNDRISFRSTAGLSGINGKIYINNPHYMLITAKDASGISVAAMEQWLRQNLVWRSYDKDPNPAKITVYVDVENGLASKASAVTQFMRSVTRAAPMIDAPGTVPENGTITFTSNAGYPAQWQMSEDGSTFVDMPGETQPYLVIDTALAMMQGWRYRVRNADGQYSAPVTLTISNDRWLLPVQNGGPEWSFIAENGAAAQYSDSSKRTISMRNAATVTGTAGFYVSASVQIPQEYVSANATVDITYRLDAIDSPGGNICISAVRPEDTAWSYNPDRDRLVSSANVGLTVTEHFTLKSEYVKDNRISLTMWNNARERSEWAQITVTEVKVNGVAITPGGKPTLSRTGHSGYDVTDIAACRDLPTPTGGSLTIKAANKVYDGAETVAVASIGSSVPPATVQELLQNATIRYSSGASTSGTAGSGSQCIDAGQYTATVTLRAADADKYGINQTATCTFRIEPRPLHLYSYGNNKTYDGEDTGTIKNITIKPFDATAVSGIVARDNGQVSLNKTTVAGSYDGTIHQTNNKAVAMIRSEALALTGARAGNYLISTEDYTGAISARGLAVHSLYQDPGDTDNNPRNVKIYDGNDAAKITNILLDGIVGDDTVSVAQKSIDGTYEAKDAGETLTPDGTAQEDAKNKLQEYKITRTGDISLTGNDFGDYYIAREDYSGAIRRRTISVFVGSLSAVYGDGLTDTPTAAAEYTAAEAGAGTELQISALIANDTLTLDPAKSRFEFDPVTVATEAGDYPLNYTGLTEENYPVLKNYIMWYEPGNIVVTPRPLIISAGDYTMVYGDPMPEFTPVYTGFVNDDTPETQVAGDPNFATDASSTADVGNYPVELSGLTAAPNAQGYENYIVYILPGTLEITRRPIIITPDPDPEPEPEPDMPVLRRIVVDKKSDKDVAAVGDTITYKIRVTNTGNVELQGVPVRDTHDGAGTIQAADGPGYTYKDGIFVVTRLPVGKSVVIQYTYTAVEADAGQDLTNVAIATVPGTNPEDPDNPGHGIDPEKPIDPDKEYPSPEVVVPVDPDKVPDPQPEPVDGRSITNVKFTDTAFAAVGDTIRYGAIITNNGTVDLTGIKVRDVFTNAAGDITPISGAGYMWQDGIALIPALAVGESITIYFDYVVQPEDAGKNLRDVVVATVPGPNPPDPFAPDTGLDPDKPMTPDTEYPSNEVVVPVDGPSMVQADPKVKIYGDADPALTYTLPEQLIKPDDIWGELERAPGETVGVYPIMQGTIDSANYDITFIPSIFWIKPAPLTVTAEDKSKIYGQENPELTAVVTGFKFEDTLVTDTGNDISLVTPATATSGVGVYPIIPSGLTLPDNDQGNKNYTVHYVEGTLAVTPALLTVTAEDKTKIYGEENPELTAVVTGFQGDDSLEADTGNDYVVTTPATKATGIGDYPIVASGLTLPDNEQGQKNYTVVYVDATLTINPRPITVTAQDELVAFGDPPHELRYVVENMVPGDEMGGYIYTEPYPPLDVGKYPILSALDPGPNYTLTYNPAIYRVVPITGLIEVYAPGPETIVRGPDGDIISVTVKPFPRTGVPEPSITENSDGSITASFALASSSGTAPAFDPPAELTYNGKIYRKIDGDVQIKQTDVVPAESVQVSYTGLDEQTVPEIHTEDNGSRVLEMHLADVQYSAGAPLKLSIDYTDVNQPTPPPEYVAVIDGVERTFTLSSLEQTSEFAWRGVDFSTTWYGKSICDFYLGKIQPDSPSLPYLASGPCYRGYENILLDYLGLSETQYRIVDSEWQGESEPYEHTLRQTGIYHAEMYAATWTATYTTSSGKYDAVATYSTDPSEEVRYSATVQYATAASTPLSWISTAVVLRACLGVLFVALAIVLILLIIKKRRAEQENPKEEK